MTIFFWLRFESLPTWRARSPYLYPQEKGDPDIALGTGFPFRRLLRLAGPRWKYSYAPPHIFEVDFKVKVIVKVTLRLKVSQSISLGVEPHLGLMARYLLLFDGYGLVFLWRPL
jgi:hypothetical protein